MRPQGKAGVSSCSTTAPFLLCNSAFPRCRAHVDRRVDKEDARQQQNDGRGDKYALALRASYASPGAPHW